MSTDYNFDRFLLYEELVHFCESKAALYPALCSLEVYGKSHEGRNLLLVTITDSKTGLAESKPAHWVDANIHSIEVTAGVAACFLIHHLLEGYASGDATVIKALESRTFYIVPRVNPDGVEAALQTNNPMYFRSSVKKWPYRDGRRFPGLLPSDIDNDGRILTVRIKDDNGAWVQHPIEPRVMIPVDHESSPFSQGDFSVQRYRLLEEGIIENYDGFTIPAPHKVSSLDLNRNFPAGWGKEIKGSGDHPLSEPEVLALVQALAARPNVCGYNAYHTAGGVLLRPSSLKSDSELPPVDVWVWKEVLGKQGTKMTGCPAYQCFDDFTWDKKDCMSGAADDFAYDQLGIFSWTTEFWDVIHAATGVRANTKIWYFGPSVEEELAICKWADQNAPGLYVSWYPFVHPQLGDVEIGGADHFRLVTNPPAHLLRDEVKGHAAFAVYQALMSPKLEIIMVAVELVSLQQNIWRIAVGVANTGFLPTNVTEQANKIKAVRAVMIELTGPIASADRQSALFQLVPGSGQLAGRVSSRVEWSGSDGTPDRHLATFLVVGTPGTTVHIIANHQRAGTAHTEVVLA